MITRDGVDWLTADEIAQQFGADITADMLKHWKARGLIRGTTIGAGHTRTAHYRRDDVEEAELRTRQSRAGQPRRGAPADA